MYAQGFLLGEKKVQKIGGQQNKEWAKQIRLTSTAAVT